MAVFAVKRLENEHCAAYNFPIFFSTVTPMCIHCMPAHFICRRRATSPSVAISQR